MYIHRNDKPSGGKKFGASAGKGTWNRAGAGKPEPRELHDATCGQCGNRCQVPFFPSGSRPVFCRDCFRTNDDGPRKFDDRRQAPRSFDRGEHAGGGASDARLRSIEKKLDMILELLDADEIA